MASPYNLDSPLGLIRGSTTKFQELPAHSNKLPENQLTQVAEGQNPTHWAPGMGQGSAPIHSDPIPWPPAESTPKPFKLTGE